MQLSKYEDRGRGGHEGLMQGEEWMSKVVGFLEGRLSQQLGWSFFTCCVICLLIEQMLIL